MKPQWLEEAKVLPVHYREIPSYIPYTDLGFYGAQRKLTKLLR